MDKTENIYKINSVPIKKEVIISSSRIDNSIKRIKLYNNKSLEKNDINYNKRSSSNIKESNHKYTKINNKRVSPNKNEITNIQTNQSSVSKIKSYKQVDQSFTNNSNSARSKSPPYNKIKKIQEVLGSKHKT